MSFATDTVLRWVTDERLMCTNHISLLLPHITSHILKYVFASEWQCVPSERAKINTYDGQQLGMHRMFGNRKCSAENCKKNSFGVWQISEKIKLYRTMTWRDQIEVCANAANTSKNCLRKTQKSLQAPTARDCLVLHHVSDEKRKRWLLLVTVMIEITKWPQTISK